MTRPLETIILALGFVVLATAARACNDGGCEPPPPPEPPKVTIPEHNDRDPHVIDAPIHYGFCCRVDGVDRYHTGAGRNPAQAALQCQARKARMINLPDCPASIAKAVRRADGRK